MGYRFRATGRAAGTLRLFAIVAAASLPSLSARGQLICENDPTRTIFAGGSGEGQSGGSCRQFDGNPTSCNSAFHLGGDGIASCFYDASANECLGCGSRNEGNGDCVNTCRANVCEADPTRVFAGPPFSGTSGGACRQFDGNQSSCNNAFTLGGNGFASCFYDTNQDLCLGCGPSNEGDGDCTNECRPAPMCADPNRTFAGPPFSGTSGGACRQFDGNQSACDQAFTLGDAGVASCFYDTGDDTCRGCGPSNQRDGDCTNVCPIAPPCERDPSRTIFAGGPETEACRQFDGDSAACRLAYHQGGDGIVSSCFEAVECVPCGSGEANGDSICINACLPVPTCLDPTRTVFAGGPDSEACRNFDDDQVACEKAFILGGGGVASCFYDSQDGDCRGCGPNNAGDGDCTNTCVPPSPPPTCAGDPTRTNFVGGGGTMACQQLATQITCEQSFHRTGDGDLASCWWDGDSCNGCGPNNERDGNCTNECRTAATTCPADPTRIFAGPPLSGQSGGACRQYDGNSTACNTAYHLGNNGYASCFYDSSNDTCLGCGPNNEGEDCINTCLPTPPCPDATRTIFTGHPGSEGCHRFDGNSTMCLQAYVEGEAGVASCWYDADDDECRGCGPENANEGSCTNSCKPPPVCTEQPSRTVFGECEQFDGDPVACNRAFQLGDLGAPIACQPLPVCLGCGLNNQADELCTNTCFAGPGVQAAAAPVLSPIALGITVVLLFGLATLGLRARRTY